MGLTFPSLDEMLSDATEMMERGLDLTPVWPTIERMAQRFKRASFKAGRGSRGPHRALKGSTRKHHRTGIPLFNKGNLMRGYTNSAHTFYMFEGRKQAFDSGSTSPLVRILENKGYRVAGFSEEEWAAMDKVVFHYINTGEIIDG